MPTACPASASAKDLTLPVDISVGGGGALSISPRMDTWASIFSTTDAEFPGPISFEKNKNQAIVQLTFGLNFRTDRLDWNIAGNKEGTNPNILSELTWEKLNIYELSLGFRSFVKKGVYLKGYLNYGKIINGENQDSDYGSDDRQDEFSRSNNSADHGNTFDISLGGGYALSFASDRFTVVPLAGMSFHQQNLSMTDGHQTITWEEGPPLGPFSGLDSTYESQWWGPWVGVELKFDFITGLGLVQQISPFIELEYHWAKYYASADWNLRQDFEHPRSFEHEAWGRGVFVTLGIGMHFSDNWSMEIGYAQKKWSAEDGIDRVFLSNGAQLETRLNEVNWESSTISLAAKYQF